MSLSQTSGDEISDLIGKEKRIETRTLLLIMHKMCNSLDENTTTGIALVHAFESHKLAFDSLQDLFQAHVKDEANIWAYSRGLLAALMFIFVAVTGVFAWVFTTTFDIVSVIKTTQTQELVRLDHIERSINKK